MTRSLTYMPALDGLRGVAVLLVFVGHTMPSSPFPGGVGVDSFFVISGFLITAILLREYGRDGSLNLRRFYVKRLLRLYPPLIALVVVTTAFAFALDTSVFKAGARGIIALLYLGNVVTTVSDLPMGHLNHTWSLAMEEQFYLLWPLVLLVLLRRRWTPRRIVLALVMIVVASMVGWVFTADEFPYNPLTKVYGLLLGGIVAVLHHEGLRVGSPAAWTAVVVGLVTIVLGSLGVLGEAFSHPIVTLASAVLVPYVADDRGLLNTVLTNAPLVRIGVISYAFYLWHFPVLLVLLFHSPLPVWVNGTVGLVVSLGLSSLSMRFIERPALRVKDRIGAPATSVEASAQNRIT